MVILRGIVRSGTASTEDADSYIANAAIIQLSSAVYTSSNGTFYTSALTLDVATCQAAEYATVQYSIPDFATIYDPSGVISGAITKNADVVTASGSTIMTDTNKIFLSGSLTSRTLSMRSGVYDGFSGIITQNTQNTFRVGGGYVTSGGGGSESVILVAGTNSYSGAAYNDVWITNNTGATWTEITSTATWSARSSPAVVRMPDKSIVIVAGAIYPTGAGMGDVWRSADNGSSWTCMTSSAEFGVRSRHAAVSLSDGSIVLTGGRNAGFNYMADAWRSTDNGATWACMTSTAAFDTRGSHASVSLSGNSILVIAGWVPSYRNTDVWISTDLGATWTQQTADGGWSERIFTAAVTLSNGTVVLAGGAGTLNQNDVWKSTDNGATWSCVSSGTITPWSIRRSHSMAVLSDDTIVLSAGLAGSGNDYMNDVWKSVDEGATWTCVTSNAEWSTRAGAGMVNIPGTATSSFVIINASSGDIYNIGGVSGESTTNIVFTLWDNKAYGRGRGK